MLMSLSLPAQTVDDLILQSEEFPPYNFTEKGVLRGTSADVLAKILVAVGSKLTLSDVKVLPWARSVYELKNTPNTVLFAMTRTPERETQYKWAGPITVARNVLVGREDRALQVTNLAQAANYHVGVIREDAGEQLLLAKGFPRRAIQYASTAQNLLKMLMVQRIDLVAYDENVLRWLWSHDPELQSRVTLKSYVVLETGAHYFAFNRQTPDAVVAAFQEALDDLKRNGTFQKILDSHLK